MDRIYTPPYLAALMAKGSRARPSQSEEFVVADFAAGSGELLLAAVAVWPKATMVATDIDSQAVRNLRTISDSWRTGVCDFLNPRSQQSSHILRSLKGRINLVLLNPPFSCRGGKRVSATIGGVSLKCSVGLAFVVNSIDYLTESGELIAVLPEGSLTSEKDATTWTLLRKMGDTEILKTNGLRTFARAAVRTAVVRFQKRHSCVETEPSPVLNTRSASCHDLHPPVRIVRGTTQMSEIQRGEGYTDSIAFIHSTHLQDFAVSSHYEVRSPRRRCAVGPMVLLPRVGQPKRSKVARYLDSSIFMLSDCVIALMCHSSEAADLLWNDLQANWSLLEQEYVGSGARYITNRRLSDLLLRIGYSPLIATSKDYRVQKGGHRNGRYQNKSAQCPSTHPYADDRW